jgi:hypothetical protein
MSWQRCPICEGEGNAMIYDPLKGQTFYPCSVCKGKKIIDTITGLPPIPPIDDDKNNIPPQYNHLKYESK